MSATTTTDQGAPMTEHGTMYDLLAAVPSTAGRPELNTWVRHHNAALIAYDRANVGAMSDLRRSERAILALIAGVEQYVGSVPDNADPLSGSYLFGIVSGIRGLLNYDLGRLDGGTLDTWAAAVLTRWGIDPDTGEWTGGE